MNQSDYRMGFAPALLCLPEEPHDRKTVKPAIGYGYRGRTNDPFEVGDHMRVSEPVKGFPGLWRLSDVRERDCVQGVRAELFAAEEKFEDQIMSIYDYAVEVPGARITCFGGGGAGSNGTIGGGNEMMRRSAERLNQDVIRQICKKIRHADEWSTGAVGLMANTLSEGPDGDGWFHGAPPCQGWWNASASKHERMYRHWNGVAWSPSLNSLKVQDAHSRIDASMAQGRDPNSHKVLWRPFTPLGMPPVLLKMGAHGRPVVVKAPDPCEDDPLGQRGLQSAWKTGPVGMAGFGSVPHQRTSNAQQLVQLTQAKCDAAAKKLDAALAQHAVGTPLKWFLGQNENTVWQAVDGGDA